jgi:hypothetical protein
MFRHTTILVLTSQTRLEIAIGQVEGVMLNYTERRSRPSALNGHGPIPAQGGKRRAYHSLAKLVS